MEASGGALETTPAPGTTAGGGAGERFIWNRGSLGLGAATAAALTAALGARLAHAGDVAEIGLLVVALTACVATLTLAARTAASRGADPSDQAGGLQTAITPTEELRRELARARRYGRTFGLMRLPAKLLLADNGQPRRRQRYGLPRHDGLRTSLRRLDLVWTDGDDAYLLLPEADRERCEALRTRLAEAAAAADAPAIRYAVFPGDGLTTEGLLESMEDPIASLRVAVSPAASGQVAS